MFGEDGRKERAGVVVWFADDGRDAGITKAGSTWMSDGESARRVLFLIGSRRRRGNIGCGGWAG